MNEKYFEIEGIQIDREHLFQNRNEKGFRMTMDWVFKTVYGSDTEESNQALIALLNSIIGDKENPITDVEILSPVDLSEFAEGKTTIMDIKARTQNGDLVDIEMQTYKLGRYRNRPVAYMSKLTSNQLVRGGKYDKMKKSIVISIIDGVLLKENDRFYNRYHILNDADGELLTDIEEYHFLELGKLDGMKNPETVIGREAVALWLKFAGEKGRESYLARLCENESEVITMSEMIFEKLSENQLAQMEKDAIMIHEYDMNSCMETAREEGRKEMEERIKELEKEQEETIKELEKEREETIKGLKKQRESEREENRKTMVGVLLKNHISEDEIVKTTGIMLEEVRRIRSELER